MKKFKYILIMLIAIYLFSCKATTTVNEQIDYSIKEILSQIEIDFNFGDIDSLITFISPHFEHKGKDYNQEVLFWRDLYYQYTFLSIDNIEVQRLTYEKAKAKFILTFKNSTETVQYNEPSEQFGDLSYFIFENGKWKLIGKDNFK